MKEVPLTSTALLGYTYDPDCQLLWIHFRTGQRYLYESVPQYVIDEFLNAPSQGQYFNAAIRGRYSYQVLS